MKAFNSSIHISNCCIPFTFSEWDVSYAYWFGDCQIMSSIFLAQTMAWKWNTLLSAVGYSSSWFMVFPSKWINPMHLPLSSGLTEQIKSVTQRVVDLLFLWPSCFWWTFSVYFLYDSKHFFGVLWCDLDRVD